MSDSVQSAPFFGGGNRRAQRRQAARWEAKHVNGQTGTRRSMRPRQRRLMASSAVMAPVGAPGYRVVPVRECDASVTSPTARVRLDYRPPRRKIPECERPSKVVVTKVS